MVTSCNSTKNELVEEVNIFNESLRANGITRTWENSFLGDGPTLQYVDHVRTYPTFRFGGVEGSRVCTAAFIRKAERGLD